MLHPSCLPVVFPAAYQASICSNYAETGAIFGASHSNSYSRPSRLDFLCLTSPKMPPRCLYPAVFFQFFTQLLHGWVPPSLAASENENTALPTHEKKERKRGKKLTVCRQSLSGRMLKASVSLLVSGAAHSCTTGPAQQAPQQKHFF